MQKNASKMAKNVAKKMQEMQDNEQKMQRNFLTGNREVYTKTSNARKLK